MGELDESRNSFEQAMKRAQSALATLPMDVPIRPDRGLVKELADAISSRDHFASDRGGQLYVFEKGAYRSHGETAIMRRVKAILEANGDRRGKWCNLSMLMLPFYGNVLRRMW
jgi:hypothetical protein